MDGNQKLSKKVIELNQQQIKYNRVVLYNNFLKNINTQGMTRGEDSHQAHKKRHYAKISRPVKEKLIKRVIIQGVPISSASKQYKIRLSTAKAIISKFNKTKQISETSKQRQKRLEKEKSSQCKIEDAPQKPEYLESTRFSDVPSYYMMYAWNVLTCSWVCYGLAP